MSQTILDSYCLSSLLDVYDEHHILEDDEEGAISVKKTHLRRENTRT